MTIKELVKKDNVVIFDSYRKGMFYYKVYNINETPNGSVYQFNVPIEDIGDATLMCNDKAITFMRWIRKSMEDGTLIKTR